MTASELIEKIHNKEIKNGAKIKCHEKNEYFDYTFTRYFMGNWFSKVPPEQHRSDSDDDREMLLYLCDSSCTYTIIDENAIDERLSKLQSEIALLQNDISKYYSKIISARDKSNYIKDEINKLRKDNNKDTIENLTN